MIDSAAIRQWSREIRMREKRDNTRFAPTAAMGAVRLSACEIREDALTSQHVQIMTDLDAFTDMAR
ncbi:hypothetical protein GCM10010116_24990 [Microbispora rosea subsp. aerata]|nr:hypothetical protein GCM10010116_24990 [Microbispora rosea subsp. aerata]GIH54061.1 hypothetical protein Mro02_09750 [Microbispora rosea subsp. aerata]GLJ85034.1 hypothetical protein GCM10017588_37620 [Microbispora rosea subsp. aerata]